MRKRKRYKPSAANQTRTLYNVLVVLLFALTLVPYLAFIQPIVTEKTQSLLISAADTYQKTTTQSLEPIANFSSVDRGALYGVNLNLDSTERVKGEYTTVITSDPRVVALRQFLIDYDSPMYPYANVFISEADKYGLDWRLVVGISGVESAFGRLIPPGSYNGWGWKGDPTRDWSHFEDWPDAITVITRGLALGYGIELTPFDIEATYCPPCGQTEGSPWANGVTRFMNEMSLYVEELG